MIHLFKQIKTVKHKKSGFEFLWENRQLLFKTVKTDLLVII